MRNIIRRVWGVRCWVLGPMPNAECLIPNTQHPTPNTQHPTPNTQHLTMIDPRTRAQVLTEALPYLRRYAGKTFVIKYGGAAMIADTLKLFGTQDVVLMHSVGPPPALVHGWGPEVSALTKRTGETAAS